MPRRFAPHRTRVLRKMNENPHAVLDLRFNGRLSRELSTVFNRLSHSLRRPFNELVTCISAPHGDSIDWWVQGPASRNTLASPFFHYFCALHLVGYLINQGGFPFDEVRVDSRVLKRLVRKQLADALLPGVRVSYSVPAAAAWKEALKRFAGTPVFLGMKACQFFIAGLTRNAHGPAPMPGRLVLIDTFMTAAYTTSDRWYGSLWENLTPELKKQTAFVPTIVQTPLRALRATYQRLRSNARP